MMMGLGDFRFERRTAAPEGVERTTEYEWPAVQRMGSAPALQWGGQGRDQIRLNGRIFPHFAGGLGQIDAMREMAGRGEPQVLVDGRGQVLGRWCIVRVQEKRTVLDQAGNPRSMEFDLELTAYAGEA